jgi:hypothetical protein
LSVGGATSWGEGDVAGALRIWLATAVDASFRSLYIAAANRPVFHGWGGGMLRGIFLLLLALIAGCAPWDDGTLTWDPDQKDDRPIVYVLMLVCRDGDHDISERHERVLEGDDAAPGTKFRPFADTDLEVVLQNWDLADRSVALSIQPGAGAATELKLLYREVRVVPLPKSDKQLSIGMRRMRKGADGSLQHDIDWLEF